MTDYTPQDKWHDGIHLIGINEKVKGGLDGPANLPHQQLADNLLHVLKRVEKLEQSDNTQAPDTPDEPTPDTPDEPTPAPDTPDEPTEQDYGVWKVDTLNSSFNIGDNPDVLLTNTDWVNKPVRIETIITNVDSTGFDLSSREPYNIQELTTDTNGNVVLKLGTIPTIEPEYEYEGDENPARQMITLIISWSGNKNMYDRYEKAARWQIYVGHSSSDTQPPIFAVE